MATLLGIVFAANAIGQRQMEKLDRGLVAINQGKDIGVFLSWRLLGTEPQELGFNVYRQTSSAAAEKLNDLPLTAGTVGYPREAGSTKSRTLPRLRPGRPGAGPLFLVGPSRRS